MEELEAYNNSNFDERLAFLNVTMHKAIEKLLIEARRKKVLTKPCGRPPTPSPFVDSEDEDNIDINATDDDKVSFDYDYGFNPLLFLSDVIRRCHPASVVDRMAKRDECVKRLTKRANHAKTQIIVADKLKYRVLYLRSGIISGPITYPVSCREVTCLCRSVRKGFIICQLSTSKQFDTITLCTITESSGPETTVKISISGLEPNTHYYMRCSLRDSISESDNFTLPDNSPESSENKPESEVIETCGEMYFRGPEDKFFASGEFWTLMDPSIATASGLIGSTMTDSLPSELVVVSRHGPLIDGAPWHAPKIGSDSLRSGYLGIVGDVFAPMSSNAEDQPLSQEQQEQVLNTQVEMYL
jgi:hypothetical protein